MVRVLIRRPAHDILSCFHFIFVGQCLHSSCIEACLKRDIHISFPRYFKVYFLSSRYLTFIGAGLILGIGLPARPDSSIVPWARKEALKRMEES